MSKHYPNGVTLEEMDQLNTDDTIQTEKFGLIKVVEPNYCTLRLGSDRGPVVQRCIRALLPDGKIYLYMVKRSRSE
jgi:hypothetical protein